MPRTEPKELNKPALSLEEAQALAKTKTAPKVTVESIEDAMAGTSYLMHDGLTIAIITMKNGFMVIGKSAAASAANHDTEIGKRYAYEDAFRGLWQYEGYLLCDRLYRESLPKETPDETTREQEPRAT